MCPGDTYTQTTPSMVQGNLIGGLYASPKLLRAIHCASTKCVQMTHTFRKYQVWYKVLEFVACLVAVPHVLYSMLTCPILRHLPTDLLQQLLFPFVYCSSSCGIPALPSSDLMQPMARGHVTGRHESRFGRRGEAHRKCLKRSKCTQHPIDTP